MISGNFLVLRFELLPGSASCFLLNPFLSLSHAQIPNSESPPPVRQAGSYLGDSNPNLVAAVHWFFTDAGRSV